jgi:hypothetical protein
VIAYGRSAASGLKRGYSRHDCRGFVYRDDGAAS